MNNKQIVTEYDYQLARFILNNISAIMTAASPAKNKILQTAERVMIMYHLQSRPKPITKRPAIAPWRAKSGVYVRTK